MTYVSCNTFRQRTIYIFIWVHHLFWIFRSIFFNSIVADVYFVMIIMSLGYNIILKILYILSWSISKIKNKVQGEYFGNSKCFDIFMSTRNAIDEITVQLIHFTYIIITIALPVHMLKCEQTYRKFSVIWYLKKCDPRIFGYS